HTPVELHGVRVDHLAAQGPGQCQAEIGLSGRGRPDDGDDLLVHAASLPNLGTRPDRVIIVPHRAPLRCPQAVTAGDATSPWREYGHGGGAVMRLFAALSPDHRVWWHTAAVPWPSTSGEFQGRCQMSFMDTLKEKLGMSKDKAGDLARQHGDKIN